MGKIDNQIDLTGGKPSGNSLVIVLGLVMAGFFVGQFSAAVFTFIFLMANGVAINELGSAVTSLDSISQTQLFLSQMSYTLVFTFLTPWLYLKFFAKKKWSDLFVEKKLTGSSLGLTVLATLSFVFVNAFFIEWNAGWDLPDFMSGLEDWMKESEEQMAQMTEKFTTFDHFGQFLMAFLAVVILPSIGEEFLFRGVIQNSLHRWSKNAHLAIWVSAFIFAAVHMQFYGLVPRMMLGALFGYFYLWSGNLWYSVASHVVNNGFSLVIAYLVQLGVIDMDMENEVSLPIGVTLSALVVFSALLFIFRQFHLRNRPDL